MGSSTLDIDLEDRLLSALPIALHREAEVMVNLRRSICPVSTRNDSQLSDYVTPRDHNPQMNPTMGDKSEGSNVFYKPAYVTLTFTLRLDTATSSKGYII